MAAIVRLLARKVPSTKLESDILTQLGLLCCAGLFVAVLMITYGMDLSPGFF